MNYREKKLLNAVVNLIHGAMGMNCPATMEMSKRCMNPVIGDLVIEHSHGYRRPDRGWPSPMAFGFLREIAEDEYGCPKYRVQSVIDGKSYWWENAGFYAIPTSFEYDPKMRKVYRCR